MAFQAQLVPLTNAHQYSQWKKATPTMLAFVVSPRDVVLQLQSPFGEGLQKRR